MEIPQAVKRQARNLIEQYGFKADYIGECDGQQVFQFKLPNDQENGFPIVYLYNPNSDSVLEVSGMRALEILIQLL